MIQIDMPMPENCLDCPFCNEYWMCDIPINGSRKLGTNDVREFSQSRPEWCPLKEQEAKTGKWIQADEDTNAWECSECGALQIIIDGTPIDNSWFFCPHCGAKQEGR